MDAGGPSFNILGFSFSFGDLINYAEDAWHWVEERFKDAVKWGCQLIGE
jgi:hypothetical protein